MEPLGSTDPELEALMADYPSADEAGKAEIAREVNEWVVDNVWFAPIMRPDTFNFYGDSIEIVPQVQQAIPSIWSYTPTGK